MGRLKPVLNSIVLVCAVTGTVWNLLLDDQAKTKLVQAGEQVKVLANFMVNSYMDPNGQAQDDFATENNRSWVEQQWKEAGY